MENNIWVKNVEVYGITKSIIGMRNPLDSWSKSDTAGGEIGEQDIVLAKKLIKLGGEHRKFLRQIQVWCDIQLPRYVWQELDTYKFGTKNSCSTIHTIKNQPVTIDDFYLGDDPIIMTRKHMLETTIPTLNYYRELYLQSKDYRWIKEMKRILPESFVQMRTWNTNYEELRNIYQQRKHHKLNEEWKVVLDFIEDLPYGREFLVN